MAGRPRRTLKEIIHHAKATHATLEWIRKRSPKLHQERTDREDAVGTAWSEAADTGKEFWGKLGDLGRRIAERAGLAPPYDLDTFPMECDGYYETIAEWCKLTKVPPNVALARLRNGHPFEAAVFRTPTVVEIEESERVSGAFEHDVAGADEGEGSGEPDSGDGEDE